MSSWQDTLVVYSHTYRDNSTLHSSQLHHAICPVCNLDCVLSTMSMTRADKQVQTGVRVAQNLL